jgi:hypothetical protein
MKFVKVEPPLFKLDQFVQRKKQMVTNKPVFTEVKHTPFQKHEMAHLVSYPNAKHPKEYAVVLKDTFYNRNKNTNLPKLKQIAAHELAHIIVPHAHSEKFRNTARRLGAGRYANTQRG